MEGWLRYGNELRQPRRWRGEWRNLVAPKELELAVARCGRRHESRFGLRTEAVDAKEQPGPFALDLDRSVAGSLEFARLEPAERPADRRGRFPPLLRVDRAGDDQAVHR